MTKSETSHDWVKSEKHLFGMLHLPALPGSHRWGGSLDAVVETALAEAAIYAEVGFTGLALENMHDRPYLNREVGPETVAAMTRAAVEVRRAHPNLKIGIQVLAGANQAAVAVSLAAGLDFVRAEGFVFGHVADEGWMESDAPQLLRYRAQLKAEQVALMVDVKKKHSAHAATSDVSLAETVQAAAFFEADGVIVTGRSTGEATLPDDLAEARAASELPVWIGSGITPENIAEYRDAHGLIVGSSVKENRRWDQPVCPDACRRLADAFHAIN
jgi:membrane complex biogenesis BtpA family protein